MLVLAAEIQQLRAEEQVLRQRGDAAALRDLEIELGQVAAAELFWRRTTPGGVQAPRGAVAGAEDSAPISPAADAAREFAVLIGQCIALNRTIRAESGQLPVELVRSWTLWLKAVEDWGRSVSQSTIAWYLFPGWFLQLAGKSILLRFYGPENYNAVRRFKIQFKEYHDQVEQRLGRSPLGGIKPTPPGPPVSVTPTLDVIKELAGTALTIVVVGGLAYVVGSAISGHGSSSNLNLKLAALRPGKAAAATEAEK